MDGDLDVLTVTHLAATGGIASEGVLADHAGALGSAAHGDGIVTATSTAPLGGGVCADKGAGLFGAVHTAGALGALGGENNALHLDLAGDVEAPHGTSTGGELEDRLVQETHVEGGVIERSAAATGEALLNGDLLGLARGKLN